MAGSMLINGMMAFFTLALIGAISLPIYLYLPAWMAGVKARRIAFHASAIDALDAEIARPQRDRAQLALLIERRHDNATALLSLDPAAEVPPLAANSGFRAAA